MKIQEMLLTEIGVLLVSKVEELEDNIELNCWREKNEKERLPLLRSTTLFMTQENADTFPILICRDNRYGPTDATCCARKSHSILHFICCRFHQRSWVFARKILKCDDEPSTKSLQDAHVLVWK